MLKHKVADSRAENRDPKPTKKTIGSLKIRVWSSLQ